MINRWYGLLILILLTPIPLLAYLDPGSGSMLFSALIGIVATLFFVLKGVFYKLLSLPAYLAGKKAGIRQDSHKLVFYSEGKRYWPVFQPIIEELDRRGIQLSYLTSEEDDPALSMSWNSVEPKYIGVGNKAFFLLNTLQADVCVMTTPGLDVLQIKRSRGVKKYVHVTHSAGGCSGYSVFGLDYYDVVLTGGEADKEFIRAIEQVRNIPKKEIEVIGCTYLDVMRSRLNNTSFSPIFSEEGTTVLISPTWGEHGLLNKHGKELLSRLTESEYRVIVRPHPQSLISEEELIAELQALFPNSDTLLWDTEADGLRSMSEADIMISDFSGIIFDYLFLFSRPVLTVAGTYDRRGKDSMDYDGDPWNIRMVRQIGGVLNSEDIASISARIASVLSDAHALSELLPQLHEDMDKYPGESGTRGADALERVMKKTAEQ